MERQFWHVKVRDRGLTKAGPIAYVVRAIQFVDSAVHVAAGDGWMPAFECGKSAAD